LGPCLGPCGDDSGRGCKAKTVCDGVTSKLLKYTVSKRVYRNFSFGIGE
jgi:hypothetical protein